jgi:hypothetical protein
MVKQLNLWNSNKKNYNNHSLTSKQLEKLIDFYINKIALQLNISVELIIVFGKMEQYSLYWNAQISKWNVSSYSDLGWTGYEKYNMEEFNNFIEENSKHLERIKYIKCTTKFGVKLYKKKIILNNTK